MLQYIRLRTRQPSRRERKAAYRFGWLGEIIAIWVLRLKGYKIMERRFRRSSGEIDLVARRGRLLVFVEVKARQNQLEGLLSLSPRQEERIRRTATLWQAQRDPASLFDVRFDLMVICPYAFPLHLKNAF